MTGLIKGKVFKFGDNIDTDQIYPGRYLDLSDYREIAEHVMEGVDAQFRYKHHTGDIIVAGKNFGCGSSREHAVITLKAAGVGIVIAESFARIFFRNAINTALPLLIASGVSKKLNENEEIEVDFEKARIIRFSGEIIQGETLSEYIMKIYQFGGAIKMYQTIQNDLGYRR